MASYQFKRTIASFQEDGSVVFETQENIEVIEIAKDWCDGEKACAAKQPYHETGYVGKGSSKYGIYVSEVLPIWAIPTSPRAEGKISGNRICHGPNH